MAVTAHSKKKKKSEGSKLVRKTLSFETCVLWILPKFSTPILGPGSPFTPFRGLGLPASKVSTTTIPSVPPQTKTGKSLERVEKSTWTPKGNCS